MAPSQPMSLSLWHFCNASREYRAYLFRKCNYKYCSMASCSWYSKHPPPKEKWRCSEPLSPRCGWNLYPASKVRRDSKAKTVAVAKTAKIAITTRSSIRVNLFFIYWFYYSILDIGNSTLATLGIPLYFRDQVLNGKIGLYEIANCPETLPFLDIALSCPKLETTTTGAAWRVGSLFNISIISEPDILGKNNIQKNQIGFFLF